MIRKFRICLRVYHDCTAPTKGKNQFWGAETRGRREPVCHHQDWTRGRREPVCHHQVWTRGRREPVCHHQDWTVKKSGVYPYWKISLAENRNALRTSFTPPSGLLCQKSLTPPSGLCCLCKSLSTAIRVALLIVLALVSTALLIFLASIRIALLIFQASARTALILFLASIRIALLIFLQ